MRQPIILYVGAVGELRLLAGICKEDSRISTNTDMMPLQSIPGRVTFDKKQIIISHYLREEKWEVGLCGVVRFLAFAAHQAQSLLEGVW